MKFRVSVQITLRPSILDPQGKAIQGALAQLGQAEIESVRMGKYAELIVEAASRGAAQTAAQTACETLLANPVMEDYEVVTVQEVTPA